MSLLIFLLCRCEAALGEFLRGIKRETKNVNFADMVNILVIHSQSEGSMIVIFKLLSVEPQLLDSLDDVNKNMVIAMKILSFFADEVIQFTAITWLREFITLSGRTMLPFNAGILKAILPCMAYDQDKQNILF